MAEREVVLDEPEVSAEALEQANARAERAEAELARLKHGGAAQSSDATFKDPPSPSTQGNAEGDPADAEAKLRKDSMMAHLLDSLAAGKDIGHYGRLVFAIVTRHFMPHDEVLAWLTRDKDFSDEQARLMLRQVEGRDYTPPRRDRILEWQSKQDFPILPHPDDPDCGNLYRNLTFREAIYEHIGHYQEVKMESDS
jgi:hypothetical protein